jgi:anti-sigma B factor antagonist
MDEEAVRVEVADDGRSARLSGELDMSGYDRACDALAPLFEASGDVTLNLSDLSFLDSSGIRLFLRLHESLGDRGRLVIEAPADHVARVLEIAGLPKLGIQIDGRPADG